MQWDVKIEFMSRDSRPRNRVERVPAPNRVRCQRRRYMLKVETVDKPKIAKFVIKEANNNGSWWNNRK